MAAITIATLFSASTTSAEVTAPEVWTNLKTWFEHGGNAVDVGGEDMSGDTLAVDAISIALDINDLVIDPDDIDGELRLDIPSLTFRELGDGTVGIFLPSSYGLSMTVENVAVKSVVTIRHGDLSIIARGDASEVRYHVGAADLSLNAGEFDFDGNPGDVDVAMTLSDYTGVYSISPASGLLSRTGNAWIGAAEIAARLDFPPFMADLALNMRDYSRIFRVSMPEDLDRRDAIRALAGGLTREDTYSIESTEMIVSFRDEERILDARGNAGKADISMDSDKTGLRLSESVKDISVSSTMHREATGNGTTIDLSMAEFGIDLLMPILQSDESEDFTFGLRFIDLDVPELLWDSRDPDGVLPRDPVTLLADISGKGKWLINIMDRAGWETLADGSLPGEVHQLALNEMRLSAAGAEFTGEGELTFDNSDPSTFDIMPPPEGAIRLKLTGGNNLLDKLVRMGVMSEEQAMAARMTTSIFTEPGPGEDELNSTIEINAEGSMFANGQRLR